jgi:hypothetical protein
VFQLEMGEDKEKHDVTYKYQIWWKTIREVGEDQVQEQNWRNTKLKKGWSIVAIVGIMSKCICLA